jgi:hypothetical protein
MSGDKRRAPRHRCRIAAKIRIGGKEYDGHIVDISQAGIRVISEVLKEIWTSDRVEIFSADLGWMAGIVRWRRPGDFGVRLDESSNTRAKFEAFRKNFALA